jgi:hypothetical protein
LRRQTRALRPRDVLVCSRPRLSVILQARGRQEERLVVHVELDDRRVGHIHDRLAGLGESGRAFGMHNRPGLVEPVDECPGDQRRAALLEAAPDADKPLPSEKTVSVKPTNSSEYRASTMRHSSAGYRCSGGSVILRLSMIRK